MLQAISLRKFQKVTRLAHDVWASFAMVLNFSAGNSVCVLNTAGTGRKAVEKALATNGRCVQLEVVGGKHIELIFVVQT